MIWYISRNYKNKTSAGNKAKTDMEQVMQEMGFGNAGLPQTTYKNTVLHFIFTLLSVLRAPWRLHRGDILFIQYPLKKYFSFLCNMAHLRGAKVVILVHDLGSFRRKALTPEKENMRLSHADYIIALNQSMEAWIRDHGCKKPIGTLGIWDYLSPATHKSRHRLPEDGIFRIVYAGGMSRRRNTFLYSAGDFATNYRYILYGNGFDKTAAHCQECFECKGFTPADTLITTAEGDFGLVWDGSSTGPCEGAWGEYLKYNTPHKLSLYIRCGLPVIVYAQSAMAPFVKKEGIGLCIDTLEGQLSSVLKQVTGSEYEAMLTNVEAVNRRISTGCYFKKAAQKAIDTIKED